MGWGNKKKFFNNEIEKKIKELSEMELHAFLQIEGVKRGSNAKESVKRKSLLKMNYRGAIQKKMSCESYEEM